MNVSVAFKKKFVAAADEALPEKFNDVKPQLMKFLDDYLKTRSKKNVPV